MQVKAYIKDINQAPRKVAIVASLVRGRTVADALVILSHVERRSALPIKKAIESAKANATHNHNLDANSLIIDTISATIGKRLRRYRPASRGRALPYQKKSTNLLVIVSGKEKPKPKPAAKSKTTTKKVKTAKKETK